MMRNIESIRENKHRSIHSGWNNEGRNRIENDGQAATIAGERGVSTCISHRRHVDQV